VEISSKIENDLAPVLLEVPGSWDEHLAHWISDVLSPPLIAVAGLVLAAIASHSAAAWLWAGLHLFLSIGVPMSYVAWKVHQGKITDIHMRVREQRIRPMLLTLVCSVTALSLMWLGGASQVMLLFSLMGVFQVGFLLLVTLRWKISGHGAAIGSMAVFLFGLFGSVAIPAFAAVPLVAWARLRLNRHDLAQTVAGSLVGISFMLVVIHLVSMHCQGFNLYCGA
jgi:hypothetical protein